MLPGLEAEKSGCNYHEIRLLAVPLLESSPRLVLFPRRTDRPDLRGALHGGAEGTRNLTNSEAIFNSKLYVFKRHLSLKALFPGSETRWPSFCTLSSTFR